MDDWIFLGDNANVEDFSKDNLFKLAYFEPVTNFYNWNWMLEKLCNYDKYDIDDYIFIHFDIKDFKMINEIYGHAAGDNMLRKVCSVLKSCDWIYFACRCDNDNFAMMAKKMENDAIWNNLDMMFRQMEYLEEDPTYPVYYRCGIAAIEDIMSYGTTVADLAKMAQSMGMKANETEINFYTEKMKEEQLRGKMLKKDLDRAMSEEELLVYYQPKYNPQTNELVGAEALIRWDYKHEQILPPADFVPYFESEGTISRIDRYVLERVCMKLEQWKSEGKQLVPISINMSRAQLYSPVLIETVLGIVNRYDVDRKYIEFELTESMAYYDSKYMIATMNRIRELGFMLSIDDFGTGYSSLSLLANMPLTTLKIDKSFVDDIAYDGNARSKYLVRNILDITKNFKISSVAEGVETEEQRDILKEMGVDYIQGFYYSRPVPEADFEKLLK